MAHPLHCYYCKKFGKEISRKEEGKRIYRIIKCEYCGKYTLTSTSHYIAVWGGVESSVSIREIEPETELWEKYLEE